MYPRRPMVLMSFRSLGWLAVAVTAQLGQCGAQVRDEYAIVLRDPPLARQVASRRELASTRALDRVSRIRVGQTFVRGLIEARHIPVHGSAHLLVNAIFVFASTAEADALRHLPGVSRVEYLPPLKRQMDRAIDLIRAPGAWNLLGGESNAGAGVKIGIIDTGIEQMHAAFQDDALAIPDGFPKGSADELPYTNNKVIVARSYVAQLKAADDVTPRDHFGHGTALAMIAAGVRNAGPAGTIVGVAPKAYLGNYKVFGSPGVNDTTTTSVLVNALQDALNDGMDVVTLAVGAAPAARGPLAHDCPDSPTGVCDLRADAVENASRLGLAIVVPAGNDGDSGFNFPTLNTINTPGTAPSAITVGSSTNSHVFYATVLAAGRRMSALFGDGPKPNPPLAAPVRDVSQLGDDGLACSSLRAAALNGAIALVQRGNCAFSTKVGNAQNAGAVGVIIYQPAGEDDVFTPGSLAGTGIPAVLIGSTDGLAIKSLLRNQPDARVTLDPTLAPVNSGSDGVADFSSHGPSIGDVTKLEAPIKPELVAPGRDVYTATQSFDPKGDLYDPSGYTAAQGTSFSAAMVAGAVAVVKQQHPGFSVAQLKSAVVNTAADEVNDDQGRARVTAVGAGKLNVGAAAQAGATVEPAALSIGLIGPGSLPQSLALNVTNTSGSADTFNLAVAPRDTDAKAQLTVTPASLQLDAGQTSTVTIRLTGSQPLPGAYGGAVTIQGANSSLRVPYLYMVGNGVGSDLVPIVGGNGFVGVPGDKGFSIAFKLIDRFGVPVNGATVRFRVVSGGGFIERGDAATDVFGIAAAVVDLGAQLGEQQFSADVAGMTIDFFGVAQPPLPHPLVLPEPMARTRVIQ